MGGSMAEILEKLAKIGWIRTDNYKNPLKLTLTKNGSKRTGVIKIDIENKLFVCYNLETTYYYNKTEIRDITLQELVLVYKLISKLKKKYENKNTTKTE